MHISPELRVLHLTNSLSFKNSQPTFYKSFASKTLYIFVTRVKVCPKNLDIHVTELKGHPLNFISSHSLGTVKIVLNGTLCIFDYLNSTCNYE